MKKSIFFFTIAASMLFFASCGEAPQQPAATEPAATEPAKPDLAQIRTEIQALENAWADALNAKDINALMALYADDAVSLANNGPSLAGKAAIQQYQEEQWKTKPAPGTFSFETKDVYGDGNVVTEVGTSAIKDASGKVVSTGKYMVVFEKRDGKYLCIREIYNDDKK
jgi:uncharacterized protein (TIGR02246 family)